MTVGESTEDILSVTFQLSGYRPPGLGSLGTTEFTYRGTNYSIERLHTAKSSFADVLGIVIQPMFPSTFDPRLTLELDGEAFLLKERTRTGNEFAWSDHGLTWTENQSVAVKLITPPLPNAYGYRTIWTAEFAVEQDPNISFNHGYKENEYGKLSNNMLVTGRDESITVGTEDQPRFPWTGYKIVEFEPRRLRYTSAIQPQQLSAT